jgi:uncharacterized protein
MLDKRAKRIVWAFLLGVIVAEGSAILLSFHAKADLLAALIRFAFAAPGTFAAWSLAALITVLYVAFAAAGSAVLRTHLLRPSRWRPYAAMVAAAVPMALISGFFEEAFFRKTLMDVAQHRGAAIGVQIAVSALAFGAVHAVWGAMGGSLRGALGAMLATSALGAALAAVYAVGGRSIAPCIAAHIAINLLIEPWLIITAATRSWTRSRPASPPMCATP